jgi:hypothetical protein
MGPFAIQGFSALLPCGLYTSTHGHIPWDENQRGSPLEVNRKQVYSKPHPGFGKLNAPDKLAFSAASLVLENHTSFIPDTTGICLGTTFASLSTDLRYMESVKEGFPRPGYFSATLPSSPIAEIAILFKLKGPDRVVVDTKYPGFSALENAMLVLENKKASAMLVVIVSGIEPQDMQSPLIPPAAATNYAFAFMLTPTVTGADDNYRISLAPQKNNHINSQNNTEESYFFSMISAMLQKKDFHTSYCLEKQEYVLSLTRTL